MSETRDPAVEPNNGPGLAAVPQRGSRAIWRTVLQVLLMAGFLGLNAFCLGLLALLSLQGWTEAPLWAVTLALVVGPGIGLAIWFAMMGHRLFARNEPRRFTASGLVYVPVFIVAAELAMCVVGFFVVVLQNHGR